MKTGFRDYAKLVNFFLLLVALMFWFLRRLVKDIHIASEFKFETVLTKNTSAFLLTFLLLRKNKYGRGHLGGSVG